VIGHIVEQRERVWLARPGDISRHVEALAPGTVPGS
jgi:allantoinase